MIRLQRLRLRHGMQLFNDKSQLTPTHNIKVKKASTKKLKPKKTVKLLENQWNQLQSLAALYHARRCNSEIC